ncbi:antibiotic biosynthesis monooxygenase [Novipirellula caenicola]|uniref:ABM domain-containing protein n=1 Tax=Novipirellula caenicola TaxID=1536901 RepID=A0ABP9VV18_9BACT
MSLLNNTASRISGSPLRQANHEFATRVPHDVRESAGMAASSNPDLESDVNVAASASTQPATIFVTALPKAGREREWEQAIGDLIRTSLSFPGHLGSLVLRPQQSGDRYYRVISKFDSVENMQRWHHSDQRKEKVSRLQPLERKPADIHHLTGLETWFELPHPSGSDSSAPPKYKMAIVVWIAVYAAVLPLVGFLKPYAAPLPSAIGSAGIAAISVAMMTWGIMPFLTWLFQRWLYPPVNVNSKR